MLPLLDDSFRIIDSKWNYSGKIFSMIFILLFIIGSRDIHRYFLSFKLKINKTAIILILIVFFLFYSWVLFVFDLADFQIKSILFQILNAINEELNI